MATTSNNKLVARQRDADNSSTGEPVHLDTSSFGRVHVNRTAEPDGQSSGGLAGFGRKVLAH